MTATPAVVAPKFTIEGMVFDDLNGNGTMDNNETGLADWTVNLEQPAGMVIMSANTTMDGKFMFTDLSAGEYVVSEVLKMGWTLVSPADGKFSENVTDMSVTGLVFANQAMPVAAENTLWQQMPNDTGQCYTDEHPTVAAYSQLQSALQPTRGRSTTVDRKCPGSPGCDLIFKIRYLVAFPGHYYSRLRKKPRTSHQSRQDLFFRFQPKIFHRLG